MSIPIRGRPPKNLLQVTPWNTKQCLEERNEAFRWCFTKRRFQKLLDWHAKWHKVQNLMPPPVGDADKMNEARLLFICVTIIRLASLRDMWPQVKRCLREELHSPVWGYDDIDYSALMETPYLIAHHLNNGTDPLEDQRLIRVQPDIALVREEEE